MFVGVLRLSLRLVDARSLKDKRRVAKSFQERAISRFRVSVAEVGALDDVRSAHFGVAIVSNEAAHADSVLSSVTALASTLADAILTDHATEIVPFGMGGHSVQGDFAQRMSAELGEEDES